MLVLDADLHALGDGADLPGVGGGAQHEHIGEVDELAQIDGLETGVRGGPEPDFITLENFGRDIPEA